LLSETSDSTLAGELLAEYGSLIWLARASSELVDEEDTSLWRLIARVVKEAHAAADWSEVCSLAIDETSSRRGCW
jgi:hypothetical protein